MDKPNFTKSPQIPMMRIQGYERYLPSAFDESLSILQKINKVIYQLNNIGLITNDLIKKWNELMEWIVGNGLTEIVSDEIDKRIADGTFDELIYRIVGDLTTLTTSEKDNLVGAINEINKIATDNKTAIGDISELTTDEKENLVLAINELKAFTDINKQAVITIGEATGFGVISGLKVVQQKVLSMGVDVGDLTTPNIVHLPNGERYTLTSIAIPIAESHNTLNRYDIIFVNSQGKIEYKEGILAIDPRPPVLPDNSVLLAEIFVQANDTTINNVDIIDKRPIKTLNDLKTQKKDNFVQSINELVDSIATVRIELDELESTTATNIADAIAEVTENFMTNLNDLEERFGIELADVETGLNQLIGNLTLLSTDIKTDIVSAINELVQVNTGQNLLITQNANKLIVSTTKPTTQKDGDIWYQTSTENLPPLLTNTITVSPTMGLKLEE